MNLRIQLLISHVLPSTWLWCGSSKSSNIDSLRAWALSSDHLVQIQSPFTSCVSLGKSFNFHVSVSSSVNDPQDITVMVKFDKHTQVLSKLFLHSDAYLQLFLSVNVVAA